MTKDPTDTETEATDFVRIRSNRVFVGYDNNKTTNLIKNYANAIYSVTGSRTANFVYAYDANGKITSRKTISSLSSDLAEVNTYAYDEAGQLVREDKNTKNTWLYEYDANGNITKRKTYNYTAASAIPTTLVSTDTFTYATGTWEDRLVSYNGQSIDYDDIGNPITYLGASLTWRGRELANYTKGTTSIDYSYDVDSMRYQKVVKTNGAETSRYNYVYADGQLILLSYTANGATQKAKFIYDSAGEVLGFIVNGTTQYLYVKNLQGDIVSIVNESGVPVVRYIYDAWGNTTITTDSGYENLVNLSPFAYRGYCYDNDIKMYYLQSRYYDPQICRFINADSSEYLGATETVLSYNLFAYCENDPVNWIDETGYSSRDYLKERANTFGTKDNARETFCKLLVKNGKGFYTSFHELAQILIAKKLSNIGYSVFLERPCEKNNKKEMDVFAQIRVTRGKMKKYVWEVKPKGTSAEKQIAEYIKLNTKLNRGFSMSTIKQKICKNLTLRVTFDGKGGAFYAFYDKDNNRISNADLKKAIQAAVYAAITLGVVAVTVGVVVGFLLANPAVASISGVSAGSVSTGTLITLLPVAAEAISKAA